MKLAILVIMIYSKAMTSQIVPADKCEVLGKQFTRYAGSYSCLYYEPGDE